MRFHFRTLISITLSVSLLVVNLSTASAADLTGVKCSTVGQKKNGFICTKVNKKNVWQKKKNDAAKSRSVLTLDNLDLKLVPTAAYESIKSALTSRAKSSLSPKYILGPSVKDARVQQEIIGINRAIDLWSPIFMPDSFQVVYFTEKDAAWIEKKAEELGIPAGFNKTYTELINEWPVCSFAFAGKDKNGTPTFIHCVGGPYVGGDRQTGPHEYTHLVQDKYKNFGNLWFDEGSAVFVGWSLGFHPYDPKSSVRTDWLKSFYSGVPKESKQVISNRNIAEFQSLMLKISGSEINADSIYLSYWAGGLAAEVLVGVYGFEKYLEFCKSFSTSVNISEAMEKSFGVSAEDFYRKLAPYIWANSMTM